MNSFLVFIKDNFAHVAPILAVGAFAAAVAVERVRALYVVYPMFGTSSFFDKIRDFVLTDRISEAITLCDRYKTKPVAQIVREALMRAHQPEEIIQHGLEIAVSEAQNKVQRRTAFLSTIANVSTLLGLFGTILGLIQSFEAVGAASAQQRSALLAAGISTAMNATMMGLGVAIPCMLVFAFLAAKTNRLNSEVEQAATRALDVIKQRYYGEEAPRQKRAA